MDMGFHIGLNGCSLKTPENLATAVYILPEWLMFETGMSLPVLLARLLTAGLPFHSGPRRALVLFDNGPRLSGPSELVTSQSKRVILPAGYQARVVCLWQAGER